MSVYVEEGKKGNPEGLKRHHKALVRARALTVVPHFFDPALRLELVRELRNEAEIYRDDVGAKVIVLKNTSSGELVALPYRTRFDDDYIQVQRDKLKLFFDYQVRTLHRNRAKFLTLTLDPMQFISMRDGYEQGQKAIHSFMTALAKIWSDAWVNDYLDRVQRTDAFKRLKDVPGYQLHLKKESKKIRASHPLDYVMVKEIQEKTTKNVHWHLMIFGVDWISEDMLKRYWGLGFYKILNVSEKDNAGNPEGLLRYMMKYLRKGLTMDYAPGELPQINETLVCLWAMGIRAWSSSRMPVLPGDAPPLGLDPPDRIIAIEISDVWVYLGTFSAYLPWSEIESEDDLRYWSRPG